MPFTAERILPDGATREDKISKDVTAEETIVFDVATRY